MKFAAVALIICALLVAQEIRAECPNTVYELSPTCASPTPVKSNGPRCPQNASACPRCVVINGTISVFGLPAISGCVARNDTNKSAIPDSGFRATFPGTIKKTDKVDAIIYTSANPNGICTGKLNYDPVPCIHQVPPARGSVPPQKPDKSNYDVPRGPWPTCTLVGTAVIVADYGAEVGCILRNDTYLSTNPVNPDLTYMTEPFSGQYLGLELYTTQGEGRDNCTGYLASYATIVCERQEVVRPVSSVASGSSSAASGMASSSATGASSAATPVATVIPTTSAAASPASSGSGASSAATPVATVIPTASAAASPASSGSASSGSASSGSGTSSTPTSSQCTLPDVTVTATPTCSASSAGSKPTSSATIPQSSVPANIPASSGSAPSGNANNLFVDLEEASAFFEDTEAIQGLSEADFFYASQEKEHLPSSGSFLSSILVGGFAGCVLLAGIALYRKRRTPVYNLMA